MQLLPTILATFLGAMIHKTDSVEPSNRLPDARCSGHWPKTFRKSGNDRTHPSSVDRPWTGFA